MKLDEPIRVLRVIARLNVGGPALHVSYLTSELNRIGYDTLLVAVDPDDEALTLVGGPGTPVAPPVTRS